MIPVKTVYDAQATENDDDDVLEDLTVVGPAADGPGVEAIVGTRLIVDGRFHLLVGQEVGKVAIEDRQHADEEGDGGHDHLPRLARAEFAVRLEQLSQRGEHHFLILRHFLKKMMKHFYSITHNKFH